MAQGWLDLPSILELCLLVPLKGLFVLSKPERVEAEVSWEFAYAAHVPDQISLLHPEHAVHASQGSLGARLHR